MSQPEIETEDDQFYGKMQTLVKQLQLGKVESASLAFIKKYCRTWCPSNPNEAANLFLTHLWRFPNVIIKSPRHARMVVRRLVYKAESDCFSRHLAKTHTQIEYLDTGEVKASVIPRHKLEYALTKRKTQGNMIELQEIYINEKWEEPSDGAVSLTDEHYSEFIADCLNSLDDDISLAAHVYFADLDLRIMAANMPNPKKRLKELRVRCEAGREKITKLYFI